MRNYNNYDDYDDDDYEVGGFKKMKSGNKKKTKYKGHQSKRGNSIKKDWAMLETENDVFPEFTTLAEITPKEEQKSPKTPLVLGVNTHEIRNVKIDFDRVDDILKINSEHNGHMTYGIKFLFSGNKGLNRVIWFNQNQKDRDTCYNTEYKFWLTIKAKNNKKV